MKLLARKRPLAALAADCSGVGIIEFALTIPLVTALALGGIELANLALTHMRVSQIALTVADNAGRVTTRIDEADIDEVFAGAELVGEPIDFAENGRVVLSSLQHNDLEDEDEGQMINWQRCFGDLDVDPAYGEQDDGKEDGSLQGMGPAGREIQSVPNTAVMFVEVSYQYAPVIGGVIEPRILRYESAFIVRGRTEHDITNARSGAVSNC
jgi:hypothetical protein